MDLTRLKRSRTLLRRIFTKTKNEIEEIFKSNEPDLTRAKALIEVLEARYSSLKKEDTDIYNQLLDDADVSDDAIFEELKGQEEYSVSYQLIKREVEVLLLKQDQHSETGSLSIQSQRMDQVGLGVNTENCSYKLPLLKFKEFGKVLKDWVPFCLNFQKLMMTNLLVLVTKSNT